MPDSAGEKVEGLEKLMVSSQDAVGPLQRMKLICDSDGKNGDEINTMFGHSIVHQRKLVEAVASLTAVCKQWKKDA